MAAYLLKKQGYDCIGATMRLHEREMEDGCGSFRDMEDAKNVCRRLGIPHFTFDFTEAFQKEVIRPFVAQYEQGKTPNPCILCNRKLKFQKLYQQAMELNCDYVATGHYVRREQLPSGAFALRKALDENKEQSYVLYDLTQQQLRHTLFPIGNLRKAEVREIALREGFLNAEKHDSQDICFVPDGDYGAFIQNYTGKTYLAGPVLDVQGRQIGTHQGIHRYTIGQRKGLGLALGQPMYVKEIDPARNAVVLAKNEELFFKTVFGEHLNWMLPVRPETPVEVLARVRYHQQEQPATLYFQNNGQVRAEFKTPQRAVTPGQSIVFYQGDLLLGGAEIVRGE